jgi:hypothetical protein
MFATLGMGKLPKDEIRSTVHLPRELTEQFEKACEKKYGKDWKKKTGYKEAMQNFVNEILGEDKQEPEVQSETPTQSTEIVTSDNMSVEEKEAIAKKLADERKKQQELQKPPPPFPKRLEVNQDSDIISFLNNVPKERKIKITRVEIE